LWPKHVIALLLAVFVTAAFSLSAARASAVSARIVAMTGIEMSMQPHTNMIMPGMRAVVSSVVFATHRLD